MPYDSDDIFSRDFPSWETIAKDWHRKISESGLSLENWVKPIPAIVSDMHEAYPYFSPSHAWWPYELDEIKWVSEDHSLLTGGVSDHWSARIPNDERLIEMGYQSAGMRDGANIIGCHHSDPDIIAATLISLSVYGVHDLRYQFHRSSLKNILTLAEQSLRIREIIIFNAPARKSWLPFHTIEECPESYEDAMSALVDEHKEILTQWRIVRYVPFLYNDGKPIQISQAQIDEHFSRYI